LGASEGLQVIFADFLGFLLGKTIMAEQEFRHIVRIVNTDLDGNKPILHALRKIKGVSFMYANMACSLSGINKTAKTGYLNDAQVGKLDETLRNPVKFGAPIWILNRRKDVETGEDSHLMLGDLDFTKSNDIKRLQMIRSRRGMRHAAKLPLRGQRTRSNFRKNKGKVQGIGKKKAATERK